MSDPNEPTIAGYTVLRLLGVGGMGYAYLIRNDQDGEMLVYKVVKPIFRADPSLAGYLIREIKNISAMTHANTVRQIPSITDDRTTGFAMEYCDLGNLFDYVTTRGGALSVHESLNIFHDILAGLEFMHSASVDVTLADGSVETAKGLVHRDLKPENILLCTTPTGKIAKVADYGLAKSFEMAGLSGQTLSGQIGGTRRFMCRQQMIEYKYALPEVDLWAALAILYFMLCGENVRNFSTSVDDERIVFSTLPVSLKSRARASKVPDALAVVIDEALRDDRTLRYQAAGALMQAVRNAVPDGCAALP